MDGSELNKILKEIVITTMLSLGGWGGEVFGYNRFMTFKINEVSVSYMFRICRKYYFSQECEIIIVLLLT